MSTSILGTWTPLKFNMEPDSDGSKRNLLFQGLILRWTMLNFMGVSCLFLVLREKQTMKWMIMFFEMNTVVRFFLNN